MGFWEKVLPRDIVAVVMIVGGVFLKWQGYNGTIDIILIGIAGCYFGSELFRERPRKA